MIPGPVPVQPEVLGALAQPVRSHTVPETAAELRRSQRGIRARVGSESALVHVISGSGTLAMEVAIVNHVRPGDRGVVCSEGYFGDRFVEIATAIGAEVTAVRSAGPRSRRRDVAANEHSNSARRRTAGGSASPVPDSTPGPPGPSRGLRRMGPPGARRRVVPPQASARDRYSPLGSTTHAWRPKTCWRQQFYAPLILSS